MLALFRTEMVKQVRRARTYVALGLMIVIPVVITVAIESNPPSRPAGFGDRLDAYTYLATRSGAYLGVAALLFMSRFLLVVVVALFAGDAIASEASWGNLRSLLVRDPLLDVLQHGLGLVEGRLLEEHPDGVAGREGGVTIGRLLEPRHDLQDGGLTGTVRSDDADLRAGQEAQRDVVEDHLVAGRLARLAQGVDELSQEKPSGNR